VQRDLFPALRGVGSVQLAFVAHRDRASYTGDNWRNIAIALSDLFDQFSMSANACGC
jgi:hypothetical protein